MSDVLASKAKADIEELAGCYVSTAWIERRKLTICFR